MTFRISVILFVLAAAAGMHIAGPRLRVHPAPTHGHGVGASECSTSPNRSGDRGSESAALRVRRSSDRGELPAGSGRAVQWARRQLQWPNRRRLWLLVRRGADHSRVEQRCRSRPLRNGPDGLHAELQQHPHLFRGIPRSRCTWDVPSAAAEQHDRERLLERAESPARWIRG